MIIIIYFFLCTRLKMLKTYGSIPGNSRIITVSTVLKPKKCFPPVKQKLTTVVVNSNYWN